MKKFVITILIFFLPILISMGLLEYGMRRVPNDYSYKNQWLTENISHLHIWCLGSSHTFSGINPRYFSKPAFNSAHVSQPLKYDAFIFRKYVDKADSLEWIIIPISYFSLSYRLEDGVEAWRTKNYCIYYNCPYFNTEINYHSEIIGNPLSLYKQILRVGGFLFNESNDIRCDSLGMSLDYTKDKRTDDWYKNGEERVKLQTDNLDEQQNVIQENKDYIESVISKCKEKNVSVLLLTTPVCSTFYNIADTIQYSFMVETCNNMVLKYDNVHYLNLFRDDRFEIDDFFDADHLETKGAAKLTKIIDSCIRNRLNE